MIIFLMRCTEGKGISQVWKVLKFLLLFFPLQSQFL